MEVTSQGQLILLLAPYAPLTRHHFRVLTHSQAGARLAISWQRRAEQHARTHSGQDREALHGGPGATGIEQDAAHFFIQANRCVRGRVHTAGNAALDLAERNLVGNNDRCFEPGATGLLQIEGRCLARQGGGQDTFAHQIEVT